MTMEFWLCFVPLFVAVDAVGVLPFFLSLTEGLNGVRLRSVILQSVVTAALVALGFLFIGPPLLRMLGITVPDFMVAGGALLFLIAMGDMMRGEKARAKVGLDTLGAVPIGVPLITGPAVLTTTLLLMEQHGHILTSLAIVANVLIAGLIFLFAAPIGRFLGGPGTKTISKIASLLLAAIAVMVVRKGLTAIIQGS